MAAINQQAKILGTRLFETMIIGGVILFGVVQVLKYQAEKTEQTLNKIDTTLDKVAAEQSRRTVPVKEGYEHTRCRGDHCH